MEEMPVPPAFVRLLGTEENGTWNGELQVEGLREGLAWSVRVQGPAWKGLATAGYRFPFGLAVLAAGEAAPSGVGAAAGLHYQFDLFPRSTRIRAEVLGGTFVQGLIQTDYEFWPQWEISALYRYRHPGLHAFGVGLGHWL